MTDAVMSDLVQRNAQFSCTVGVYWPVCSNSLDTEKLRKWQLPGANMCGKQYLLLKQTKKSNGQMGDCLSSEEHFCKCSEHGAQFQVFSMKSF